MSGLVGDAAYKVKVMIKTSKLKSVVKNSHMRFYFVDTWKSRLAAPSLSDTCKEYHLLTQTLLHMCACFRLSLSLSHMHTPSLPSLVHIRNLLMSMV